LYVKPGYGVPAAGGVEGGGVVGGGVVTVAEKFAETVRLSFMVNWQVPEPEHCPPQESNLDPDDAAALSETEAPSATICVQLDPHPKAPAESETVPDPEMTRDNRSRVAAAGDAVIANDASAALAVPLLTAMIMLDEEPATFGVPDNKPVVRSNVAHDGMLVIVKASVPLALLTVGRKLYAFPTCAVVVGVPEICSVLAALTVMLKAGKETLEVPSVTKIWIPVWMRGVVGSPLK
jgi:hypothetical protein